MKYIDLIPIGNDTYIFFYAHVHRPQIGARKTEILQRGGRLGVGN